MGRTDDFRLADLVYRPAWLSDQKPPRSEFRLEDLVFTPPWLEKPRPSQESNVISFEQYRRARLR